MSTRNLKKVVGTSSKSTELVDSDDDDYKSGIAKPKANSFAMLEIQSLESQSESEGTEAVTASAVKPDVNEETKKGKKKKNNKKRNSKKSQPSLVDDIDALVREVNEELGEPASTAVPDTKPKQDPYDKIFSIKKINLNFLNELDRFLGDNTNPHSEWKDSVRNQITPFVKKKKANGLSMSLIRTENGITYYCFDHSPDYQKLHMALLYGIQERRDMLEIPIQTALKNMHVEGILEAFVLFCRGGDYNSAKLSLEQVIGFSQCVAHPFFNITNVKTRLEYKYMENRPFHIAVLLYSHLLSSKACHRTALELAKLLLNLDPSDPLSVMFILDVYALGARQHAWFIEAVDCLDKELNLKYLFNIQYSYAMAHFHIAKKKKECLKTADELLKKALIMFPVALNLLIPAAAYKDERSKALVAHPIFNKKAAQETNKTLYDTIALHSAFIGPRWREPDVFNWLVRNALELIDLYENDPLMKEEFENKKQVRQTLFRSWPIQVYRHLCLIKPMMKLLLDEEVPELPEYERIKFFDPAPDSNSINRYNYKNFRLIIVD